MSTITFDTLKFAERLEKAGATHELAIAMIEVQKESLSEVMDAQLATKADIRDVRADMVHLDRRMDGIDAEIKLLKWMVGLSLALSTGMIALLLRIAFTLPPR
jgi:acetolactate synthase small subunit